MSIETKKPVIKMIRQFASKTLAWARPYQYARHGNIVLHEFKGIYFYIPKVACSSIKLAIAEAIGVPSPDPDNKMAFPHRRNYPYIKRQDLPKYEAYFRFAFVRNPWDRILSCYQNKIVGVREGKFGERVLPSFLKWDSKQFNLDMTFGEFVETLMDVPDAGADPHYRSQFTFVEDDLGRDIVNFVGRFENLQDDFEKVATALSAPELRLPHVMQSPRNISYRDYYNSSTRKLIERRFSKDIEKFEYSF